MTRTNATKKKAREVDAATAYRHSPAHSAEGSIDAARAPRLPKKAAVAADLQTTTPPVITIVEVTTAQATREFEEARLLALKKGQAAAAVSATMAKAKLAGLLAERPENNPERAINFDGNYTDAARRIAFLLRLAADETSNEQQP